MEIKYLKSAATLLDRDYANRGGLDLFIEELWVAVGQRTVELPAVEVGGQRKILLLGLFRTDSPAPGRAAEFFFTSNFDSQ